MDTYTSGVGPLIEGASNDIRAVLSIIVGLVGILAFFIYEATVAKEPIVRVASSSDTMCLG